MPLANYTAQFALRAAARGRLSAYCPASVCQKLKDITAETSEGCNDRFSIIDFYFIFLFFIRNYGDLRENKYALPARKTKSALVFI